MENNINPEVCISEEDDYQVEGITTTGKVVLGAACIVMGRLWLPIYINNIVLLGVDIVLVNKLIKRIKEIKENK